MDDILCGTSVCFKLLKWTNNDIHVLPDSMSADGEAIVIDFEKANATKVLGCW